MHGRQPTGRCPHATQRSGHTEHHATRAAQTGHARRKLVDLAAGRHWERRPCLDPLFTAGIACTGALVQLAFNWLIEDAQHQPPR